MSAQDDINAALDGDEAAIKALDLRFSAVVTAEGNLQKELDAANTEAAMLKAAGSVDVTALTARLAAIKTHADAIGAAAAAPLPPSGSGSPTQGGAGTPVDGAGNPGSPSSGPSSGGQVL